MLGEQLKGALWLLVALGCSAPKPPGPLLLPVQVKEPIESVMETLDGQLELLGAHEGGGWLFERYRLRSGLEVIVSLDPSSTGFTYQSCVAIPSQARGAHRRALVQALERASALERSGAQINSALFDEAGCVGVTAPPAALEATLARAPLLSAPKETAAKAAPGSVYEQLRALLPELCSDKGQAHVVSIAGALDRGALLRALSKLELEPLPRSPCAQPSWTSGQEQVWIEADAPELLIAWPAPPWEERLAVEAGVRLMTLQKSALLKHASSAQARLGEHFEVHLVLEPSSTATAAIAAVERALSSIGKGETTGRQLERVRGALRAQRARALMGLESRARLAARLRLQGEGLDQLAARQLWIEKLTEQDIRAAASALDQRRVILGKTKTSTKGAA